MTPADPDDTEVQTEFKRIEHERIAQERAEALEDVEPDHPAPAAQRALQTWHLIALAAALVVGLFAALFANRQQTIDDPRQLPSGPPTATKRSYP